MAAVFMERHCLRRDPMSSADSDGEVHIIRRNDGHHVVRSRRSVGFDDEHWRLLQPYCQAKLQKVDTERSLCDGDGIHSVSGPDSRRNVRISLCDGARCHSDCDWSSDAVMGVDRNTDIGLEDELVYHNSLSSRDSGQRGPSMRDLLGKLLTELHCM